MDSEARLNDGEGSLLELLCLVWEQHVQATQPAGGCIVHMHQSDRLAGLRNFVVLCERLRPTRHKCCSQMVLNMGRLPNSKILGANFQSCFDW